MKSLNRLKVLTILLLLGSLSAFGGSNYTPKLSVTVNTTGAGKVYVSTENTAPNNASYDESGVATGEQVKTDQNQDFYVFALETNGAYKFEKWTGFMGDKTDKNTTITVSNSNNDQTLTANFIALDQLYSDVYAYTEYNGEYLYLGRGGDWGTQAIPVTKENALKVNVIDAGNDITRIQYNDTKECLHDVGAYLLFTNNITNKNNIAYNFKKQKVGEGYKLLLATDDKWALGISKQEGPRHTWNTDKNAWDEIQGEYLANQLVLATEAPVWHFSQPSVTLSVTGTNGIKMGTFVAPFDFAVPENVSVYTVDSREATGHLNLTDATLDNGKIPANTPVILGNTTTATITSTLSDWPVGKQNENASDLLKGTYDANGTYPSTAYVLQKNNGVVAFYKVGNQTIKTAANRAYINVESSTGDTNPSKLLYSIVEGNDDATTISAINSSTEVTVSAIYTMSGVKTNEMQKGVNLVKYSDGSIKKVMVK